LKKIAEPESYKELEILVGLLNWHRDFVKDFASLMVPLYDLQDLGKKRIKFVWNEKHSKVLMKVLEAIKKETMLYRPGVGEIHVYVDAGPSNQTIGGHMFRVDKNNNKYLLGYYSRKLRQSEINYDTPKLEMMALWWVLHKNRKYFYGHDVVCFTDHKSLTALILRTQLGFGQDGSRILLK
jgi:hypothetical protein